jgi:cell division protein ZapA
MNNVREDQVVFEVLGCSLKLKEDEKLEGVTPNDIVSYVQNEAARLLQQTPGLNQGQVAVLIAMKLAGEKLALEHEYRDNIRLLHRTAKDAFQYIENISPTVS